LSDPVSLQSCQNLVLTTLLTLAIKETQVETTMNHH